ncbi:MAG: Tn3 family transposase [Acaryochloris sp. CRU_2_0]|nr:Tn3 family transposase [Acaryochloris sp. CRU_2_0]
MNETTKRLKILGVEEIEALYERPCFTHEERVEYFTLSNEEETVLQQLHSNKSRLHFVLQLGYFKARHLFFFFYLGAVREDAKYIQEQYFPKTHLKNIDVSKGTRLRQQKLILELYNFQTCRSHERQKLEAKAQQAVRVDSRPLYVFRELMQYLARQCIVSPAYSVMQDIVGKALTSEQNRLTEALNCALGTSELEQLKALLKDTKGLYEITLLKREPKDFSRGEIAREVERGQSIQDLYGLAKILLPCLELSGESINYYASLVTYYSVFRLKQLEEWIVYLYLLCFVYHRYQKLYDNLLSTLIYHVRRYIVEAKSEAKERVYNHRLEDNSNLQKAGKLLKLFTDDSISEQTPFMQVRVKAFKILERQKIDSVAELITSETQFDETAFQWDHIDKLSHQFKLHLRQILQAVDWSTSPSYQSLTEAIHFLKDVFSKGRPLSQYSQDVFPQRFINNTFNRYLYQYDKSGGKHLLPDRYEFLVYRLLRNGLESGDVFCRDSVRFRSFEDDLLDDHQWQEKDALMVKTGLAILKQPIEEQLAELEEQLENRLYEVNQRIALGENHDFEVKKRGPQVRWTLQYPHDLIQVNHAFFDVLQLVDISSVLHYVNEKCHFMEAFEHVLGRYAKQDRNDNTMIACLIAWASNMGLGQMGDSSDIDYQSLITTSDNFIRLETLSDANDQVSNAIASMPIFKHFDINEVIHSSSDGQKFETRTSTINARHSPKYFGLKKGIVAYTLVANHIPINAEVIGANEHESHYVLDILLNNTTNIQPEIHSTDTHGANEVNFALLHFFGYQFAPRYRDIYEKVSKVLYGFKHPSKYNKNWMLKPVRKLKPQLIIDEWDNIQRILVSLALKTTSQSIIVGKLSAYTRRSKTRQALWEYDNIIRSLYLLNYIDFPPLRQNVQRALNRGESYHQLRRAVSYANSGKLRLKTEYEQQLWEECSRLVTNCIIFYNATILSKLLTQKESISDHQGVTLLQQVSPVAWQHINLQGRFEFMGTASNIDMEAILRKLIHLPITQIIID